jgi:formate dehydrogenase major subunit
VTCSSSAAEVAFARKGDDVFQLSQLHSAMIATAYHASGNSMFHGARVPVIISVITPIRWRTAAMTTTKLPKGRLTHPWIKENGEFRPASWEEALDYAAAGLAPARELDTSKSYGMFSCSKASNEVNYLAGKFTRQVMGSNNVDSCNRT